MAWEPVQMGCHFSWDLLDEKEPDLHRSIANTSWGEGTARAKTRGGNGRGALGGQAEEQVTRVRGEGE